MLVLVWGFHSTSAHAQSSLGIDLNGLPSPISDTSFSALRSSRLTEEYQLEFALHLGYLAKPLSVRVPSPAPDGYGALVVEGAILAELAAALSISHGFDLGLAMGAHVYQWGPGPGVVTGENDSLAATGATDPRVEVGWSYGSASLRSRPFIMLTLPLGSKSALAGEKYPRGTLGISLSGTTRLLEWSSQLALRLRTPVELSSTTWGSQLHLGVGLMGRLTPNLSLGPELHLMPILNSQGSDPSQHGAFPLPAEALITIRHRKEAFTLGFGAGGGIPLSQTSNVNQEVGLVRGPTSPIFRATTELRLFY